MYSKSKQSGFTLVELLVVIAIIGILTAIGIPMYSGYQTAAKVSATKQNYDSMKSYIAGEITKCSAGLVSTLNAVSGTTLNCPDDTAISKLGTLGGYFVDYAKQTMKNPYNNTDKTPALSGAATAPDTGATAGELFINSGDSSCPTGLSVQTVVQDTATNPPTPYKVYPATPECISVQ